jgi:crotonobetainyl-CoA:carnitine CoA-transferase CaiB-like acyl-CoA transferase
MDWRVFLATFGAIFLAEMGDKTQLAAMTMAAETKRPWTVFVGATLALACVSALGLSTLAHDRSLDTNAGRLADRARIVTEITECVATETALYWSTRLEDAGVPCGVVRTVPEVLAERAAYWARTRTLLVDWNRRASLLCHTVVVATIIWNG